MTSCRCIADTDVFLAKHNAAIETNMFGTPMTLVRLYKIDEKKRGRIPLLQASFCPFCGVKYERETAQSEAENTEPS